MIRVRSAEERGQDVRDWLESHHTFSFGRYHDPQQMGFRQLRVINEDRIAGGGGFPTHEHADMEILTYVVEGALEHRDSLGTHSVIHADEVQRMTAGTGVQHSEFNASPTVPVHLLQIWIIPERAGLPPGYEQRAFPKEEKRGRLCLVASHQGRDGSLSLHQDVDLFACLLDAGGQVAHSLRSGRHAWAQVIEGKVSLNGQALGAGDGAAVSDEAEVVLSAAAPAHLLLFDLA
jgi:redox-sensitive bicupin YhaK (pirin superfamily)